MKIADHTVSDPSQWLNGVRALALLPLAVVLLAFLAIREYAQAATT